MTRRLSGKFNDRSGQPRSLVDRKANRSKDLSPRFYLALTRKLPKNPVLKPNTDRYKSAYANVNRVSLRSLVINVNGHTPFFSSSSFHRPRPTARFLSQLASAREHTVILENHVQRSCTDFDVSKKSGHSEWQKFVEMVFFWRFQVWVGN